MNLKVKGNGKEVILRQIAVSTRLSDLQESIAQQIGVSPQQQKLMTGYPPKAILNPSPSEPIQKYFRSGDIVHVEVAQNQTQESTILCVREVPNDNSCCFHALAYVLESKSRTKGSFIRQQIADHIRKHPDLYNENTLEKTNKEYVEWISKPTSWGGELELIIAADIYNTEIVVLDVGHMSCIKMGEHPQRKGRVFLLFDGIHYDAVASTTSSTSAESNDVTVFSLESET
eukprot:TRINITY_DN4185_c0_g2_i6.p1 TRINITY_DN4185_c0_g2~~TRINITY_DN4185_c0_g2_i6.p1  ORF type:complete len:230 (-),score=56.49 TRINITY_DN4185_c0_g2_i6:236-925(-)